MTMLTSSDDDDNNKLSSVVPSTISSPPPSSPLPSTRKMEKPQLQQQQQQQQEQQHQEDDDDEQQQQHQEQQEQQHQEQQEQQHQEQQQQQQHEQHQQQLRPESPLARNDGLLRKHELSWLESMAARVLRQGRIPRHLAVIMDGNRRYARLRNQRPIDGHSQGFEKLSEVLCWCRRLGITEVTVYAFSIENFKRSQDEVDALMQLAERKFRDILADRRRLQDEGVCVRVLGNTSYLPLSLQQVCADLMLATRDHSTCFINIALSYTAREEMCSAIANLLAGATEGVVKARHFSEALLSSAMYSRDSPDPDLLLRTSGEVRLSDFLLWQTGFTVVEFIPSLWPELTVWQFFASILHFQWQARLIEQRIHGAGGRTSAPGPAPAASPSSPLRPPSSPLRPPPSPPLRQDGGASSTADPCCKLSHRHRPVGRSNTNCSSSSSSSSRSSREVKFDEFVERRRKQRLKDASLGKTVQQVWNGEAFA